MRYSEHDERKELEALSRAAHGARLIRFLKMRPDEALLLIENMANAVRLKRGFEFDLEDGSVLHIGIDNPDVSKRPGK